MAKHEKQDKRRVVNCRYLDEEEHAQKYALMNNLRNEHHPDLRDANIALAWGLNWKPDLDGRITECRVTKEDDKHREIYDRGDDSRPYDFVIELNEKIWNDRMVPDIVRRKMMDKALCYMDRRHDGKGEPLVDERDRDVYRLQHEDFVEFTAIIRRYPDTPQIQQLAKVLDEARERAGETWVGYRTLQGKLQIATGVQIPLETIMAWPQSERNEAMAWAKLRTDPSTLTFPFVPPKCVLEATGPIVLTEEAEHVGQVNQGESVAAPTA